MRRARRLALAGLLATSPAAAGTPGESRPCFDFDAAVVEPLRPPLPIVSGRDNSEAGTRPDGVVWSATRALLALPITTTYARLLDHRNHKDMRKTVVRTTELHRAGYLDFHRVDVVVTVRPVLLKIELPWTEEWGFRLLEGTREAPRKVLASYQKVGAGTKHLRHQCGSYLLQATDDGASDLSMYDEVIADHRSAEDTRSMQAGILQNLRQPRP